MGLSDIFARIVALIGAAMDPVAAAAGRPARAGRRQHSGDPGGKAAGHPDTQDADGQGMGPRADAGCGTRAQSQCVCERPQASPLDLRAAQWRRNSSPKPCSCPDPSRPSLRLRHDQHDEARCRRGSQPKSHHAVARRGWRRRGRNAGGVPGRVEPAVRHGAAGRHVLCRQHRWRGCLPLRGGREPHHCAGAEAGRVQGRRPLDAKPAAKPGWAEALRRRRLVQQYRRERHGRRRGPRRHPRARSGKRQKQHVRRRSAQSGGPGMGASDRRAVDSRQRARRPGRRDATRLSDLGAATGASMAGPIAIGGRRWTSGCRRIRLRSQRR